MSFIYMCTVYSLDAPEDTIDGMALREFRYQKAMLYTAEFTKKGEVVFSPILHSHPLALKHMIPGDFKFWEKIDFAFIDSAERVRVIMMDGWDRSRGVTAEVNYARSIDKPIEYVVDNL
jgi:hypothetical protein